MPDPEFDVAILGAGPVGCALALALGGSGLRIALVGGSPGTPAGGAPAAFRPLALSYASRIILERIGAWDGLATTPIEEIHISQAGGFGRTKLSGGELGLPALGYVADYGAIATHLANRVDSAIRKPAMGDPPLARLIVHAEGLTQGQVAEKDYGHTAIVAAVESERPAHGVAWERFTTEGPLALLPLAGKYGVVWSRANAAASALMAADDRDFLGALQAAF